MTITVADIKNIIKRKIAQYGCKLSKNNPYYLNDGAIKHAEMWFNEYKETKNLPAKMVQSIENHFKNLKNTYLFN